MTERPRTAWIDGFRAWLDHVEQGITPVEQACLELLARIEKLEDELAKLKGKKDG